MKSIYSFIYFLILALMLILIITDKLSAQENRALAFSNSNWKNHGDFVYLGSPNYNFGDKLTVAAWVKWNMDPTSQPQINGHEQEGRWANLITIDKHNAFDQGQFWLQHSLGNTKFEWAVKANNRSYVQSSTSPANGQWYFLVGVYDGSADTTMKFYVNGVLESFLTKESISGNIAVYNSDFRLNFARVPSGYRLFTGNLDEIRIYKRALNQNEIRLQMFSKETINNTDLLSYWTLDAASGSAVIDYGNANINGVYYTALVDVHPIISSPPYQISDADKDWIESGWVNKNLKTVAGAGVDESNLISANTRTVLTLQNSWINAPVEDGQQNMTWFGIEDPTESSQWVNSEIPLSSQSAFVNSSTYTTVGAGGTISVTITSSVGINDNLVIYQSGSANGSPILSGESFPNGVTKRSNILWGINEWGNVTADVIINFSGVAGINDVSSLKLLGRSKYSNNWFEITPSSRDNINRTFTLLNQTEFYEYALGSGDLNPLPVQINMFNAYKAGNHVKLIWSTATELDNYGFNIERALAKDLTAVNHWKNIGFVSGSGNSNSPKNYSFEDKDVPSGTYLYRLKQLDNSGDSTFSKSVNVEIEFPEKIVLEQNFPNPFNPATKINLVLPVQVKVTLTLIDIIGKEISVLLDETLEAGTHSVYIDANKLGLSSGVYFYKLKAGEFTEIRKMTLIK